MKAHSYDIAAIKERLPDISAILESAGHIIRRSGTARFTCCPFHEEKTPSCQVDDAAGRFHCYGCGENGDAIDYLQKSRGLSFQDALAHAASLAGVGPTMAHAPVAAPRPAATPAPEELIGPMDGERLDRWHRACQVLHDSEEEINRLATWRGIDPACIRWAAARGLMGSLRWFDLSREAFLVEMPSPTGMLPVSVHIRIAPGTKGHHGRDDKPSWNFDPKKRGAWPFLIGDPATADYIFLLEGQWDALALISMMGWHRRETWPPIAVIGMRGSTSSSKLLAHTFNPRARLFAVADADGAGARWFAENGILAQLHEKVRDVVAFWPTTAKADLNDLVKSGELDRAAFLHHLAPLMPSRTGRGITFLAWCKINAASSDPDGPGRAARHVLLDKSRPKGRRSLRVWQRHWQKSPIPIPDHLLQELHLAWNLWLEQRHQTSPPSG